MVGVLIIQGRPLEASWTEYTKLKYYIGFRGKQTYCWTLLTIFYLICLIQVLYKWDQNFVITVPADGLAPQGARPSTGTVVIEKLESESESK